MPGKQRLTLAARVKAYIEGDEIRSRIREDGGDIGFEGMEGNNVRVCLSGLCSQCPCGWRTVKHFVERKVRERFSDKIVVEARFQRPYFA